ncbi:hypothetical protein HRI_003831200 [Hibiscus trionum]|uniref:WRKY domain-containing protein n=1 Tax=Hibiscus trionum TaxID=183268 RepID=A0A9W7IT68_HIBTR|nr:hypothetical protein HRI_003831200 [Hibiscus trionum]
MSWDTKKAIEELVRGRELTNQLRDLLSKSVGDESGREDTVNKICNTFANTLSILRNRNSSCSDDNDMKEDSGESPSAGAGKDGRGSYKSKRRKSVAVASSRRSIASALIDDGYAWRKYGQKQILNSNHPRSYYRCTHKDQGCVATKQVQMIEDDPPKYETIYLGHHTCNNTLNPSHFIVDDHPISDHSSVILSFANNNLNNSPFLSSAKQEGKEDYKPITYNASDYLLSPHHLSTFDPLAEMRVLSADHDVISGVVDYVQDLDEFLKF